MRFTLTPDGGRPVVAEGSGTRGLVLARNGVQGWYGSPAPRLTSQQGHAGDGDMWPASLGRGARTVTLTANALAGSSVALASLLDDVRALAGARLTIACDDAGGHREARGFLADDPDPALSSDECSAALALVVCCPDPMLYGRWRSVAQVGGRMRLTNRGTADSYPRLRAVGVNGAAVTYLTATCGGRTVSWAGSAESVLLDFADMSPDSGTVVSDDAFPVPPGGCEAAVASNGQVTFEVRDAWR